MHQIASLQITSTTNNGYSRDTSSSDMCMDTSYHPDSSNSIGRDGKSCLDSHNRKTDRPTSTGILVDKKIHG